MNIQHIKELMTGYLVSTAGVPAESLKDGSTKVESLGIDSLELVEMLFEVEDKFGVRVENMALLKDMTIDTMAEFLAGLAANSQVAKVA